MHRRPVVEQVRAMKAFIKQFVQLGLAMVVLAAALYALDAAVFAPRRMPPCVQVQLPPGRVCLQTLLQQYGRDKIVWIDARSETDFRTAHLQDAAGRLFPVRKGEQMQDQLDAALERMLEAAERGECVAVFCTGGCGAAEEIAAEIRSLGMVEAPVYVLEGGWDVLQDERL